MRAALVAVALLAACKAAPAAPAPSSETAMRVPVGIVKRDGTRLVVSAELALTEQQRARGLMQRRSLGADEGMLFVFDDEREQAFWMRNTLIPLDMLFIASDETVVGIVAMAVPQTDTPRSVGKPSRYVLEVNGGWAAMKGVGPGDRVDVSAALAAARRR